MQFELESFKKTGVTAYQSLFGGRISRTTFVIRVAILIAAMAIIAAPLGTILAPSSQTLNDAYLVVAIAFLGLCVFGLASAYVKRLHDMGLQGYWAIAFIVVAPYLIIQGGYSYTNYRYLSDSTADLSEVYNFLAVVPLALPLVIGMWRGQKGDNKFGPVPVSVEHVSASKFNIVAGLGAAAILIPTCIYVGLFQSGVWVGRGKVAPMMPLVDSNVPGNPFMKCWNVKGVGAGSGNGPGSGVYRDGYTGNTFNFIVTPSGQIDIAMAGERSGKSFLEDGFKIVSYGLKLPNEYPQYFKLKGLDRFMVVAIFDQGGPDSVINYTTFVFGRSKRTWPEYNVVLTSAISSSKDVVELVNSPNARGRLMIGDCMAV